MFLQQASYTPSFGGLGLMGNPMSKNLIKAGHDVTVWNRTASHVDDVVTAGASRSTSPKEVAERNEVTTASGNWTWTWS